MLPIPRFYMLLYAVKMFLFKNPDDGRIPWSVPHWAASWYESLLLKQPLHWPRFASRADVYRYLFLEEMRPIYKQRTRFHVSLTIIQE
jgi:hypothetical protein